MDGDHSAKTMEQGANSALKENDLSSGIHESVNQVVSAQCHWRAGLVLISFSLPPAKRPKEWELACSRRMEPSESNLMVRRVSFNVVRNSNPECSRRCSRWHGPENWWSVRQAGRHRTAFQCRREDWRSGPGKPRQ